MSSGTVPASRAWNEGLRPLAVQAGACKRSGARLACAGSGRSRSSGSAAGLPEGVQHPRSPDNQPEGWAGEGPAEAERSERQVQHGEKVAGNQHGLQVEKAVRGPNY